MYIKLIKDLGGKRSLWMHQGCWKEEVVKQLFGFIHFLGTAVAEHYIDLMVSINVNNNHPTRCC